MTATTVRVFLRFRAGVIQSTGAAVGMVAMVSVMASLAALPTGITASLFHHTLTNKAYRLHSVPDDRHEQDPLTVVPTDIALALASITTPPTTATTVATLLRGLL